MSGEEVVHTCRSAPPCTELAEYVRAFAQRDISSSWPEIVQPLPACLESILRFDFGNFVTVDYPNGVSKSRGPIIVVGPHTHRRALIRLLGPVESVAVFLKPLALWQLFQIPISSLVNRLGRRPDIGQ
jgi:hypothetical protein